MLMWPVFIQKINNKMNVESRKVSTLAILLCIDRVALALTSAHVNTTLLLKH